MTLDTDTLTDEDYEIARKAIEDVLIDLRDSRISVLFRNNGLVVNESDGRASPIIRMGPETAVRIGIAAIAARRSSLTDPKGTP